MNPYIHTYLDSEAIDELWSQIKQSGIPNEKVNEVQKKIGNKTKFGLGNFVKTLFADMSTELQGEFTSKKQEKTTIIPTLKFLMLEEIIEDVKVLETTSYGFKDLQIGDFVKIDLDSIDLFKVPKRGDLMYVNGILDFVEQDEASPIELLEKIKDYNPAFLFSTNMEEGSYFEKGSTLFELQKVFSDELDNLLNINDNNLTLAVSTINYSEGNKNLIDVFITSALKNQFLSKNKASYMMHNNVEVFARIISNHVKEKEKFDFKKVPEIRQHIGLECISLRIKNAE